MRNPELAEQTKNILDIPNRTENWKTALNFSRFLMDTDNRTALARQLGEPAGTPAREVHIELYWKGIRDHVHQIGGRKKIHDKDFAERYMKLFPRPPKQCPRFWRIQEP